MFISLSNLQVLWLTPILSAVVNAKMKKSGEKHRAALKKQCILSQRDRTINNKKLHIASVKKLKYKVAR